MPLKCHQPWIAAALWAVAFVAAGIAGGSCIVDDQNHCRHNGGDQACTAATPFCNQCLASDQNAGCVAAVPTDDTCYFGGDMPFVPGTGTGDATGTSASSDDVGDATAGTSGGCAAQDDRDPTCPEVTPFCSAGVCVACDDAGGDAFCAGLDAQLPVCGEAGECVECSTTNTAQCDGAEVEKFCGQDGTCSGCFEHAQCGTAGCDLYTGECLSESSVFWLKGPPCALAADNNEGTQDDPFCSAAKLKDALGPRSTVHVIAPGTFDDAPLSSATNGGALVMLGENGRPTMGLFQAVQGGHAYAQNIDFAVTGPAIIAGNTSGKLWLRDATLIGNAGGFGVDINRCTITLERSIVALNDDGGIHAFKSEVVLVSSAVLGNGNLAVSTHGIALEDSSLVANHLTLIENGLKTGGFQVSCTGVSSVEARNSILMRSAGGTIDGCRAVGLAYSAVSDSGLVDSDNGVVKQTYMPSLFVDPNADNPHLNAGTPFKDLAVWAPGDPRLDLDGEDFATGPGATNYVGCDKRP